MNKNNLTIPGAIVAAGIIIAAALLLNSHGAKTGAPAVNPGVITSKPTQINMKDVSADDHIEGELNSKVIVVEYGDLECPYCKSYQPVLHQILSNYGTSSGKVAWVFRHFPIHSKAPYEAEASECAAEQGGNTAFFKYIDQIYNITKADNNLDPKLLTKSAGDIGLDTKAFQKCLDSGKYQQKIQASYNEAVAAGARGTPYTVFITKDGKFPLSDQNGNVLGAVGYDDLKGVIDNLLAQTK
jgi:protein-disulfide isomerase